MNTQTLWKRYRDLFFHDPESGFALDVSRVKFPVELLASDTSVLRAQEQMEKLEAGAIANPDEGRMVGHYWLRDSARAPSVELRQQIDSTIARIKEFSAQIHSGKIANGRGERFTSILLVGIGGSALGPQFVSQALSTGHDPLQLFFFDNTDPDGMQKVLACIPDLSKTICIVTSKSGGTKETRNGQLIAKRAYEAQGLDISTCFVAVTGEGSELDKTAVSEKWLARFPMWDWVGGRTSEFSAVGLLPAALQGFDIDSLLRGAREMDQLTRRTVKDGNGKTNIRRNPAALMALMWHQLGGGRGQKDMVVLPYKDRLELFSRYLQQLVMESLGKEKDLQGKVVNQGIAVYGNKGSTDQHAYVQQLREGLHNFFVTFIEVLEDDSGITRGGSIDAAAIEVEPGITSGDYLSGFFQGTRSALFENARESITITIPRVNAYSVGQLIALFERAVGLYASLIGVNAYHQPGVEAGKKAAAAVLELQKKIVAFVRTHPHSGVEAIAEGVGAREQVETVFMIARHLAANGALEHSGEADLFARTYSVGA